MTMDAQLTTRPADELSAMRLVGQLGAEGARSRLTRLDDVAQARMDNALAGLHPGLVPSGFTVLNYMSGEELAERHLLIIGLSLVSNEQVEAGQRVRDRLLARRQAMQARRLLTGANVTLH